MADAKEGPLGAGKIGVLCVAGKSYKIRATLGRGLTSKVVLATKTKSGREQSSGTDPEADVNVALKILNMDRLRRNEKLARTVNAEIAALEKISHKHVLALLGKDPSVKIGGQDNAVLVLELAPNGELFDYLYFTGSFTSEVTRTYFTQLMSAIEHCHERGIVHRDLKPENLLLDKDFQLKVADFGFSSYEDVMHTYAGTKSFMAPEILDPSEREQNGYTKACDLWCCGVVLFIMRTGIPPYGDPDVQEAKDPENRGDYWFRCLRKQKFDMFWKGHEYHNKSFAEKFKGLVEHLLQFEPSKRADAAEILKDPWMKGKVLDKDELKAELKRKKPAVEEGKRIEALQKQGASEAGYRAVGRVKQGSVTSTPLHGNLDLGSLPTPPLHGSQVVQCYTFVEPKMSAKHALNRLVGVLGNIGTGTKFLREGYEIDAHIPSTGGSVELMLRVYAVSGTDTQSRISVRRLGGPWLEFRKIYRHLQKMFS